MSTVGRVSTRQTACPFCGGQGDLDEIDLRIYAVVCQGCGAIGPGRDTTDEAVRAWNTRPPFAGLPQIPQSIRRERPGGRSLAPQDDRRESP